MHSMSYFKVKPGSGVSTVCSDIAHMFASTGAKIVYVGRCIGVCMQPSQFPAVEWDLVLLAQHSSKAAAVATFGPASAVTMALANTEAHYSMLMCRPLLINLVVPLMLTACKIAKFFLGPFGTPFTAVNKLEPGIPALLSKLKKEFGVAGPISEDAVVFYNLTFPHEDKDEKKIDINYQCSMARMLGEVDGGPQHYGKVETLPSEEQPVSRPCGTLAAVLYPGREFVLQLFTSTFWAEIGKGKKLDNTLSVATVPISLDSLVS